MEWNGSGVWSPAGRASVKDELLHAPPWARPAAAAGRPLVPSPAHTSPCLTLPQAWQWWRLRVREKSQPQFMHIMTCETGTRVGGLSPRLTPSLSRICSNGVRRAAGSGDQLGRRAPSCRGVCVYGGAGWTPLQPPPPRSLQGADLGEKWGQRGQALGCTGTALSRAAGRTQQCPPDGRRCSTSQGPREASSPPCCAGRRPAPGPCSPRGGPGSRSCATRPSPRRSCGHEPD